MAGKVGGCCGGGSGGSAFTCGQLGTCSVTALSDVDTTTAAPAAGNTLVWDGTNWVPGAGGGGGGLTAVTTQDTATVDLNGAGTAASPLTATVTSVPAGVAPIVANDTQTVNMSGNGTTASPLTSDVIVAPEPNGLEAGATGLLVAPSSDAGNSITMGTDGRLYAATSAGGGLNTVATQDTPTVDLAGDGTAGNPITATVISVPAGVAPIVTQNSTSVGMTGDGTTANPLIAVAQIAPEPNGLEDSPGGLLVAPSADTGNQLVMGADGRLFVPPEPAPMWGQEAPVRVLWQTGQPNPPTGSPEPQGTFTAPEDGIYDVDYVVTGSVSANTPAAAFNANITVRTSISDPLNFYVAQTQYADGTEASISGAGSVTVSRRVQLTAGQVVTGLVQRVETGTATSTGFDVLAYWAWHKIG